MQKVVLDNGDLPGNPVDTNPIPNYVYSVYNSADPTNVIATDTASNPANVCLKRIGNGTTIPYYVAAYLNQSLFNNNWPIGSTLYCTVTYTPTMESVSWTREVPAGSSILDTTDWIIVPPASVVPDTYQLTVTANVPGMIATGAAAAVGQATPWISAQVADVADLVGIYSMAPVAGGTWAPATIEVVAGDFMTKTDYTHAIEFTWTADPDTYSYTLYVTGPDGIMVTGPQGGFAMDYMVNSDVQANLLGMYTADAAPAGFEWVVNPIEVTADGWTLITKKGEVNGTRTSSPKVHYAYEKTIEFVLAELPPTYDYPAGTPVVITVGTVQVDGGNGNNVPGGMIPPVPNGAFVPEYSAVFELVGAGPWTITFATTQPWGAWYSYTSGGWMMVPNIGGFITFVIPAGGKDVPMVPIVLGPVDPTLPVELSSFTAVLTAQNFVKLTWVSQSETEMLGYRVYRGESSDQASALLLTPSLIGATNTSTTQTYSITDNEVAIGNTYWYWLESVDYASSHFHGPVSIIVEGEVPPVLPETTSLKNAYPNPFRMNSATNIEVAVKAGENGTVTIYNILGQAVKTFPVSEGFTKLNWNGRDTKGNVCGSGIYFYKLSTPTMNQTKKMVIVK